MFRYSVKQGGVALSFLPNLFNINDKLENVTETEKKTDTSIIQQETGIDRLKKIFEVDEFGNISYEANSVLQVAAMSMFVGAIYGGVIQSRSAYLEFMKNNQATSFKSHFDAKKKLQDKVTISFGKGAFRWGWRLTLFSSSFVAIANMISTYRGKHGIIEYVIAGGTSGALYKFNMGPRGWIVGGGLGSVLGLFCGGVTQGILKLAGISMDEARYWQNEITRKKTAMYRQGLAQHYEQEDLAVIKLHNDKIGEAGKDIANLEKVTDNSNVTKEKK